MGTVIKVKNFGKIQEAKIELKPLTLFVGDNNSGKSYLLSLLWGINNIDFYLMLIHGIGKIQNNTSELVDEFQSIFNNQLNKGDKFNRVFNSKQFIDLLNIILKKEKKRFVNDIFLSDKLDIEELSFEVDDYPIEFTFTFENNGEKNFWKVKYFDIESVYSTGDDFENILGSVPTIIVNSLIRILNFHGLNNATYLPSSRTGFMLSQQIINQYSRKNLLGNSLFSTNKLEIPRISSQYLTKPILNFLDALEVTNQESQNSSIVEHIENNILHGKILKINEQSKDYGYTPNNTDSVLPFRITSAVVTEISPLIIFLKNIEGLKSIYYEEPEMCLHPQLQLEMGKILVRLVNSGINIVATTHSDIILQHINNMCVLNSCSIKETIYNDYSLSDKDCIDINKVAVYQFEDCGEYSTVKEITPQKNYFAIPTFENALSKIFRQTEDINGLCEE